MKKIKLARLAKLKNQEKEQTEERLKVKEIVTEANLNKYSRSYENAD